jgi:peptidoglycan/xylan/chitin deacetylase (PgdA/CDA1 family)
MSRRVPILLYHRVGDRDGSFMDNYTVSPKTFAEQMDSLRHFGWQPVPLENVLDTRLNKKPRRPVVLTFDDGFASNREHAWPVLAGHRFPSATFLVTDYLGGVNTWDGPSRASYPLLSTNDLASADPSLMTFHSHSATHADLTFLTHDSRALKRELEDPRHRLAGLTTAGAVFAYPRGSWNWDVMESVRDAGYAGACTSMEGVNSDGTNPFLLRRIEIQECDIGWKFWLKIRLGRDITRWPLPRPPEVSILAAWLRWRLKGEIGE